MNLDDLRAAFAGRLHTEQAEMAPFLTDWRRKWTGKALAVAQPDSTNDVAAVVRWCRANGVAIVTQGGNTGLSGGATPDEQGHTIVLSTSRLNRVRAIDPVGQTITVEAGATLAQVHEAAEGVDRLFPLSLAAQGSCSIGGNLATNAGGVQVLRFGNARELCLGLEVVTAEGEVWNGLRALRKDNTGYDLRDLFIGSEGTLGIITAAVLKLFPRPAAQVAAFVAVGSPEDALKLLSRSQARLGASLTAFELLSETCLQLVEKHVPAARRPLAEVSPWYVLMEASGGEEEAALVAQVESVLEGAFEDEVALDAAVSASLAQFRSLWALREDISESQGAEGPTIKHDISLPIARIPEFIASTLADVAQRWPTLRPVVFGHLGDGNLHFNFSPAPGMPAAEFTAFEGPLNHCVHDAVHGTEGSISAEHGLGLLRRDESARYKSPVELRLMRAVKAALDPMNLMNPGKLLPPAASDHQESARLKHDTDRWAPLIKTIGFTAES